MYSSVVLVSIILAQVWAAPQLSENDMHPRLPSISPENLKVAPEETTSSYWIENARKTVSNILSRKVNQNVAKNVILFLGDGMSVPTLAASRVYLGGEEVQLSFDKFPHTALSKTYAVDRQVSDSASTATAYLCGVKTKYGTIGIGPEITRYDCLGMTNETIYAHSIAYHSQLKNKRTGLVTTARVTHASPGGVFAHTSNRDWESDTNILDDGENPQVCLDIATQILEGETGKNLNVIFGGGRAKFLTQKVVDPEGYNGERSDGQDLIQKWVSERQNSQYIWNRNELLNLQDVDNVLGLFAPDHMDYNVDRDPTMDPSLAEMTDAAIKILRRGDEGYFLFVEGARIDSAHHAAQSRVALNETIEFSKAIQTAVDLTDESDTLIVVTSDHAHTMSYSGYAERGHDVLEFAGMGSDDKVYTTLNYANGPGYRASEDDGSRHDFSKDDLTETHFVYPGLAPRESDSHGGDDVAIFAKGPWSHLFSGVLEQNVIPYLMSYASCVGDGQTACDN